MLYRKSLDHLLEWIDSPLRKPLILRGARQVGKSTLVRALADKLNRPLYSINCEKHLALDEVFKTLDIAKICRELEVIAGHGPIASDGILFLDEIQMTPHGLQALRYFYEERPGLAVVSAGSLLEFTLADHAFPMPVGRVRYHHLGPMTFSEFTQALAPELLPHLQQLNFDEPIPESAHQRLNEWLRLYMFIGGMPEAVNTYKETSSLLEVTRVHRDILGTYLDDFSKYANQKDLALLQRIFSSIPRLLGQKVKYVSLAQGERAAVVRTMIDLLIKAQVVIPVWHSHSNGVPLGADIDDSVFKLCFLDIGLALALLGLGWQNISALDDRRLVNEGGLAEQLVGQQLAWSDGQTKPELTYWQREGKSNNAEVDYTRAFGGQIHPIEVKAGKSGRLRSLHQFVLTKQTPTAIRLDTAPPSRQEVEAKTRHGNEEKTVRFELLSLPLYGAGELGRLLG